MNQFKEIPNQNYIELRFANKNARELSQDEALIKYKRNNYILGRIFSYEIEQEDGANALGFDPNSVEATEDQVELVMAQLEEIRARHKDTVEDFKKKQQEFKNILEQARHIKENEGLEKFLEEMMEKQLLTVDHPFFKKLSPFFLSGDKALVKEVTLPDHKSAYIEQPDEKTFAVFDSTGIPSSATSS